MKRNIVLFAPILIAMLVVLALEGCSRRQQAWETAHTADTPEAYDSFVAAYPEGEFAAQAKARAAELREARDWEKAMSTNTLQDYREFVRAYPDGRMSDEARIRIESFALSAPMPETAPGLATPTGPTNVAPGSVTTPAQTGSGSTQASAKPQGGYRVQLGAFAGGEKQAMGEWRRLQADFPALLKGLSPSVKLATTNTGHLYRLQAGTTDETRARSICAKLKDEGRPCVVVLP